MSRFAMTYCSQCGSELGPGDSGVSHCSDHPSEVAALRAENAALRNALTRLVGTPFDPNNGWRGDAKTSREHFACEYCNSEHLDCTAIEHTKNCPVPAARAALAGDAA